MHHYQDLVTIFNQCFAKTHQTKLVRGGDEPLYLPADESNPYHTIYFAHGYFSSALHECAHWLIAGEKRRLLEDYGYWYIPDGRNIKQQQEFEVVEIKPQAIEWILSKACGYRFVLSIDNLNGDSYDYSQFKQAIYQQVMAYCKQGLPQRAESFREKLCEFYGNTKDLQEICFSELD